MRCLYCGKELALLKRWTRGGQFCSEAHKKSYQEEYNRIGLSRLLQAQAKPKAAQQEAVSGLNGGLNGPSRPAPAAPVAVEEPVEAIHGTQLIEVAEPAVEVPAAEVDERIVEETAPEPSAEIGEETAEPALEPESMAGFINPSTAGPVPLEVSLYSHPWQASERPPVEPRWQSSGVIQQHLPEAAVLELKFRPNLAHSEHSVPEVKLTPNEFEPGKPFPPSLAGVLMSNQLSSTGVLKLQMTPSSLKWNVAGPSAEFLNFAPEEAVNEWTLLQLRGTAIDFPSAEADVLFDGESADGALWEAGKAGPAATDVEEQIEAAREPESRIEHDEHGVEAGIEPAEASVEALEPVVEEISAATEGLAQLRDGLTEDQEPARHHPESPEQPESAQQPDSALAAETEAEPLIEEEAIPDVQQPAAAEAVAPQQPEPAAITARRSVEEAVEIPLKIFTPPKPSPVEGAGALIKLPVFLPGLTGLPLRPKMGLLPAGSGSGSKKSSQRQAQPAAESKTADAKPESKIETKTTAESKAGAENTKPATEPQAKERSTPTASSGKPWGKPTMPPAAKTTKPGATGKPQPAIKITPPAAKPKEEEKPKPAAAERPVVEKTESASAPKGKAIAVEAPSAPMDIEVPHFGTEQSGNVSFVGSLKGKLAIGGVAAVLCVGAYFVFGGKSQPPAAANPAPVADKAGPSIMVAGGWVEDWAGDPDGPRLLGRKITIYRPSLKLSDYRIEFNGEIEHKSLGWVFRAADPQNYYVMKLATVTPGLEPKIALVKSIVTHGRETQVGKTPIDLNVRLDTQYAIRMDVRGSKFTTYVQGQQVDTWTDDQLKVGGVGFLNEREERGRVKSVSVSLLNSGK